MIDASYGEKPDPSYFLGVKEISLFRTQILSDDFWMAFGRIQKLDIKWTYNLRLPLQRLPFLKLLSIEGAGGSFEIDETGCKELKSLSMVYKHIDQRSVPELDGQSFTERIALMPQKIGKLTLMADEIPVEKFELKQIVAGLMARMTSPQEVKIVLKAEVQKQIREIEEQQIEKGKDNVVKVKSQDGKVVSS